MKKILLCLVVFLLPGIIFAADTLRQDININRDWKFKLGDFAGAEVSTFDDSKWDAIGLPHSFSEPYFQTKDFYTGYGWYRKYLDIKPEWISKRIFVEFAGAFQDAEIFVNGTRIGEHKGGFTGFS
jgi:beta-galactosidase